MGAFSTHTFGKAPRGTLAPVPRIPDALPPHTLDVLATANPSELIQTSLSAPSNAEQTHET